MAKPNWNNRTLFHADNLDVMREMNSETVDLIATDPPFNKGRDFHATPESLSAGASFQDRWSWDDDVEEDWLDQIQNDWPNVWTVVNGAKDSWGDDMGAYLCFMAVRLIAMHRILKTTGSIYLHCDPTASHYLKMLMDAIFGRKNFKNEIIWCYNVGGKSKRRWAPKHDTILFYTKGREYHFDGKAAGVPRDTGTKSFGGRIGTDEDGRPYQDKIVRATGKIYRYYLDEPKIPEDWWTDINSLQSGVAERTGYPTQKPLALYERFLKASTRVDDIVLDPFCGCATTLVAAERLDRQWVGIDIWDRAQDAVVERLEQEGLKAPKYTKRTNKTRQQFLFSEEFQFTSKLPKRTDGGGTAVQYLEPKIAFQRESWERLSRSEIVSHLAEAQVDGEWVICGGCGRELEVEFMELDHIEPRASGGVNDITNRILLCGPCNKKKRHKLTLVGLVELNLKDGWMDSEDVSIAKNAQTRARNRAQKVRRGLVPLRLRDAVT